MRRVYSAILWCHPREFRIRFAGEMMSIFDEQDRTESTGELVVDAIRSVTRQWLVRPVLWTVSGAVSIASLQAWWIARVLQKASDAAPTMEHVMDKHIAAVFTSATLGLVATIAAVAGWSATFLRRRATRSALRTTHDVLNSPSK